jgi:hypothetical protein
MVTGVVAPWDCGGWGQGLIAEAERFDREARKERTVTGTNVAAAIFFWPALLGTYSNSEQAINAARERKENMFKLGSSKGCKL